MNKKQTTLLSIMVWVLVAIGILIFGFSADENGIIDTFVNYGLLLTVAAVLITLFFSVVNAFKNTEGLKEVMIVVVAAIVILIISYFLSDSKEVYDAAGNVFQGSGGSISKWIGTSINYSIILLFVSGGLFLWDMLKNIVK